MKRVQEVLTTVVVVLSVVATDNTCPLCTTCICDGLDMEYECELENNATVHICTIPNSYVSLTCDGGGFQCEDMPRIDLIRNDTILSVGLYNCPLPTQPLKCALNQLGVHRVSMLRLDMSGVDNLLQPETFSGLDELQSLFLESYNGTRVPTSLLATLPALRKFTLKDSNITLEKDAFAGTPSLRIIDLTNNQIKDIPAGTFRGLSKLTLLNLWRNRISAINPASFEGLDSLKQLELSINELHNMSANSFSYMQNLEEIRLMSNPLELLATGVFSGLSRLQRLEISDNRASLHVESRALASLPVLKELVLTGCNISTLPGDAFRGSASLRRLILANNRLEILPDDLFNDQSKLEYLDLSNNGIKMVSASLFSPLYGLLTLNLNRNHIEELPNTVFSSLAKVKEILINHNRLKRIAMDAFFGINTLEKLSLADNEINFNDTLFHSGNDIRYGKQSPLNRLTNLLHLNLSRNFITEVFGDWQYLMLGLTKLDLSYNRLPFLMEFDIEFLQEKIEVDFRHNNITSIYEIDSERNSSSGSDVQIFIDDNPFYCDCSVYELLRWVKSNKSPKLKLSELKCVAPRDLTAMRVLDVPIEKLVCPLRGPNCPSQCTCIMRPSSATFDLDCISLPDPKDFPLPSTYGLTTTTLRLRYAPDSLDSLPSHVVKLNLARLELKEVPKLPINNSLQIIDLTHNQLSQAPLGILTMPRGPKLLFAGNTLLCDCSHAVEIAEIHQRADRLADYQQIQCQEGEFLWHVDATRLCSLWGAVAAGGTLALFGLLAAVLAAMYYHYNEEIKLFLFTHNLCLWWVKEYELDRDKIYDAFITYAHQDEKFVTEEMLPSLEGEPNLFKLCVHYRDWIVGEWIPAQIARSVKESRRTIVILSKEFLKSVWGAIEFRTAHLEALREGRARVIIVLMDDTLENEIIDEELRAYLRTNTYIKRDDPLFWERLRYALPHRRDEKAIYKKGDKMTRGGLNAILTDEGKIVNVALTPPAP